MNQQIYLAATVFLSVAVLYLFYQNVKLERRFNREVQSLTNNMKEMGNMIALNNDISTDKNTQLGGTSLSNTQVLDAEETDVVLAEPEVSSGLVNEMSSLMRDYSEFNEPEVSGGFEDEDTTPPSLVVEELNEPELEMEKYDSISEELKREIEELEKRDSSSEGVDEPTKQLTEGLVEELVEEVQEVDLSQSTELSAEPVAEEGEEVGEEEDLEEVAMEAEAEAEEVSMEAEAEAEEDVEAEEISLEAEELDDNIQTFDESALEALNPAGDYKNMVDEIIATASEAENNNEVEETKASWDGSVDITDEGVFVELDGQRKAVSSLSVKELTYLCKMSGIKSKGKKAELISRFTDYSTQKKNTFFLESQ